MTIVAYDTGRWPRMFSRGWLGLATEFRASGETDNKLVRACFSRRETVMPNNCAKKAIVKEQTVCVFYPQI